MSLDPRCGFLVDDEPTGIRAKDDPEGINAVNYSQGGTTAGVDSYWVWMDGEWVVWQDGTEVGTQ